MPCDVRVGWSFLDWPLVEQFREWNGFLSLECYHSNPWRMSRCNVCVLAFLHECALEEYAGSVRSLFKGPCKSHSSSSQPCLLARAKTSKLGRPLLFSSSDSLGSHIAIMTSTDSGFPSKFLSDLHAKIIRSGLCLWI